MTKEEMYVCNNKTRKVGEHVCNLIRQRYVNGETYLTISKDLPVAKSTFYEIVSDILEQRRIDRFGQTDLNNPKTCQEFLYRALRDTNWFSRNLANRCWLKTSVPPIVHLMTGRADDSSVI
ncbi:MAG: hypothetical protein K2X29_02415, partial [Candidatus Obscuribacterales bacterium]|nr:hypothetical protein [Candidatus Obscuribacterales bacterium]